MLSDDVNLVASTLFVLACEMSTICSVESLTFCRSNTSLVAIDAPACTLVFLEREFNSNRDIYAALGL